jgi:hypothetical protein
MVLLNPSNSYMMHGVVLSVFRSPALFTRDGISGALAQMASMNTEPETTCS